MSNFSQGDLSESTKQAGAFVGNKIKRELSKGFKRLVKKALVKAAKIIAKLLAQLMTKLLAVAMSFLGVTGFVVLVAVIIVGGGIIYLSSIFGWLDADSPVSSEELAARYKAVHEQTSELEEYRTPQIILQAIDNVRIVKEDKDTYEIDPEDIGPLLSADIEYIHLEDVKVTTTTTTSQGTISATQSSSSTTTDRTKKKVVAKSHTWNAIYTYSYHEKVTSGSSTSTDSDGVQTTVSWTNTEWVADPQKIEYDYSKFDAAMDKYRFLHADRELVVEIISANGNGGSTGIEGYALFNEDFDTPYIPGPGDFPNALPSEDGSFIWPTVAKIITSGYEYRVDPITGAAKVFHKGIDIADGKCKKQDCPNYAAAEGKVIAAGDANDGYGWKVKIEHPNGLVTLYGHMKAKSLKVKKGDQVEQGEVIGIMGTTGNSTGVHLHFEVRRDNKPLNPMPFLAGASK
ncbi:M23 family metallopeptidase [Paenibacillus thiaminolyticus]|uniref:M23 family metallopeptidase n=1 Tax=Paenibacillus thiaminolyticus TaxID=49283 RepID=A0A3A3GEB8_PANTH|nr:M23 family metallopeptidase [Paenibacillus thiaminolyticus]RJG21321.1 M23 family metallopeptidase [Paenibacillus thiaminolyticus]